jgi:hypothetical protein
MASPLVLFGLWAFNVEASYPTTRSIRYVVTSKADFAAVTFRIPPEHYSDQHMSIPWKYSFSALPGFLAYLTALRTSPGDVTCSIEVDGDTIETDSSTGPHAMCSVSVKVP